MLKLLGKKNCSVCDRSKQVLSDHNVEFEFIDIMEDVEKWMSIMDRFNIKAAGMFLYDDEKDEAIKVTDYIDQIKNNG